jgi:hypothetical protein
MRLRILLAMSAAVAICGCGGNDDAAQPAAAKPEPRETVFDPLTDSIQRAEAVEDTLKKAEQERRRQLEEAER